MPDGLVDKKKLASAVTKLRGGLSLSDGDYAVLLTAALHYLEQHGHEIPLEQLPDLNDEQKRVIDAMGPEVLSRIKSPSVNQ